MYFLRREIACFEDDLALLQFQAEQIEGMLTGLRGDAERRLWADFAGQMRDEISRRRSGASRKSKAATAGKSQAADTGPALVPAACFPSMVTRSSSHPLGDLRSGTDRRGSLSPPEGIGRTPARVPRRA
jgi:hypothetical protein